MSIPAQNSVSLNLLGQVLGVEVNGEGIKARGIKNHVRECGKPKPQ